MKCNRILPGLSFLLAATVAQATPVLTVGTPGDSLLATPTKATTLGTTATLLSFDALTAFTSYSIYTSGAVSVSSADGLLVLPYSTQSAPNELFDNSALGSASILISSTTGVSNIGVGIADSDAVNVTFQALGAGGVNLGSAFTENLASTESLINTGNGYYIVGDGTADIYGLRITQALSNPNYSGLAIDDVQLAATPVVTPEPSSFVLLSEGLAAVSAVGFYRKSKRA